MIFGLLFAFGAALTTGLASVLQGVAARHAPAPEGGSDADTAGSIGRLVVSPLYLGGVGLDTLGFLCMVAALHWLPLFLVQCASASSVGVTALVGRRVLGTRLGARELVLLGGLGVGLVLLAAGAKPEAATVVARSEQWWLVIAVAPIAVLGALLLRRSDDRSGGVLAAVAGLAFSGTGIASRMLSDAHSVRDVLRAPAAYALVGFGIAGMTFFAAALQHAAVTIATAALFGVETLAASAVGLLALGDTTRHGFVVLAALGFVATLACALLLALTKGLEDDGSAPSSARTATARA